MLVLTFVLFQFHKGTIRTYAGLKCMFMQSINFNSIKVQLELSYMVVCARTLYIFQFHKGTIRTHFSECRGLRTQISIP